MATPAKEEPLSNAGTILSNRCKEVVSKHSEWDGNAKNARAIEERVCGAFVTEYSSLTEVFFVHGPIEGYPGLAGNHHRRDGIYSQVEVIRNPCHWLKYFRFY